MDLSTYDKLEEFGRIRLSPSFFMRDFLHSEIAAWHGMRNVPDHPRHAIYAGRQLCEQLLEPLQGTFGRVHIRSGYRSPAVNGFGNKNKLNCASNEANFAGHIWDYTDANGHRGATACIVLPWLIDHIANGGQWTDMAWWIHDHLPYSSLCFFSKLAAFNISWHERPERRIDAYASPKGCLTRPGMANHEVSHASHYSAFPALIRRDGKVTPVGKAEPLQSSGDEDHGTQDVPSNVASEGVTTEINVQEAATTHPPLGRVAYRAVHTKNTWRKVNSHKSLESAISGKDGAASLFAGRVRIDYEKHGAPLYVLVWTDHAVHGYAIQADAASSDGMKSIAVPMPTLMGFEQRGGATPQELQRLFATTC